MTEEREVIVEGNSYCVVISDEQEALLAAKAAGRAFVGVWEDCGAGGAGAEADDETQVAGQGAAGAEAVGAQVAGQRGAGAEADGADPAGSQDWLWEADYLIGSPKQADERFLERVVRRKLGLPWIIAESERLCIREFAKGDAEQLASLPEQEWTGEEEALFSEKDRLNAYIENQYGFYEYGIWAVVRKADGRIVGMAGVSDCDVRRWERGQAGTETVRAETVGMENDRQQASEQQMELGYHIFEPYRRQGFATEACRLILGYVEQEYGCPVYASVKSENEASARLLEKLGFRLCHGSEALSPDPVQSNGIQNGSPGTGKGQGAERSSKIQVSDPKAQKCSGSVIPPCLYVRYWR